MQHYSEESTEHSSYTQLIRHYACISMRLHHCAIRIPSRSDCRFYRMPSILFIVWISNIFDRSALCHYKSLDATILSCCLLFVRFQFPLLRIPGLSDIASYSLITGFYIYQPPQRKSGALTQMAWFSTVFPDYQYAIYKHRTFRRDYESILVTTYLFPGFVRRIKEWVGTLLRLCQRIKVRMKVSSLYGSSIIASHPTCLDEPPYNT